LNFGLRWEHLSFSSFRDSTSGLAGFLKRGQLIHRLQHRGLADSNFWSLTRSAQLLLD
jgi:hypothetical protein